MTYEPIPFDIDTPLESRPSTLFPWKQIYPNLDRKPLRLSYSTNILYETCARKAHLIKDQSLVDWDLPRDTRENNEHLDFGSALGIGIANFIVTNSIDQAIWTALRNYNYAFESPTKNALSLVTCIQSLAAQWQPQDWEVAYYNGKPAVELSFKIILDEKTQDYYCGYVDLVLINKKHNIAVVLEVKSTGSKLDRVDAIYKNSAQGIGYSTILDSITGGRAAWQVLYLVFQFKGNHILPTLHVLPFQKTLQDRLEWLIDLRLIYNRILTYQEMDYWPKRMSGCLFYNKACPLFGVCDLEAMQETEEAWITKEANWDFTFTIDELIERST